MKKSINLAQGVLESYKGRSRDTLPHLLRRWQSTEGYIPSEADHRLLGLRNYETTPRVMGIYYDTSTLSATRGDIIKVILPYDTTNSHTLTEAASLGLSVFNSSERVINHGISLDIKSLVNVEDQKDNSRWEALKGDGVYVFNRGDLILNRDLTEDEAMQHPLLLTKLGHPDYVAVPFARSKDEVEEIIQGTFELGKREYKHDIMMGQFVPEVSTTGTINVWCVSRLSYRLRSSARTDPDFEGGHFSFLQKQAQ